MEPRMTRALDIPYVPDPSATLPPWPVQTLAEMEANLALLREESPTSPQREPATPEVPEVREAVVRTPTGDMGIPPVDLDEEVDAVPTPSARRGAPVALFAGGALAILGGGMIVLAVGLLLIVGLLILL